MYLNKKLQVKQIFTNMFKCPKCNKEFNFNSNFNRHKNRKIPCYKDKDIYNCKLCKSDFKYESDYLRHNKTKKHQLNIIEKTNDNQLGTRYCSVAVNIKEDENEKFKQEILKLNNINNILNNKIKFLEEENLILKQNNKIHSNNEFIYIMHCAQHINSNIYKIGRTKNIMNKFKQYPKGSELLFSINCTNAKNTESKILNNLKSNTNYLQYKESGNEYFQCNLENLKLDIQKILSEEN